MLLYTKRHFSQRDMYVRKRHHVYFYLGYIIQVMLYRNYLMQFISYYFENYIRVQRISSTQRMKI